MAILKLENVSVSYGKIKALSNINIEIEEGEIVTLIGANGAGKSTIMRTIMGLKHCDQGKILFKDQDITNKDTGVMVKNGIILSPEGRQIFPEFTVKDNLMMGAYLRPEAEKQMLALGRAIMGKPKLLLLDEPSLGLAPLIINEIFAEIQKINQMGTTILLVEQNAKVALKHSHKAYVLETGKVVLHDTAQALLESDQVQKAYFGGLVE